MDPTPELIDALRRDKIEAAKSMTIEQRLAAGGELFEAVIERMTAGILMQHPNASADEVQAMLAFRLDLARKLEERRCIK